MKLNDYQRSAKTTLHVTDPVEAITYLTLGLASEAGEVAGKAKRVLRDDHGTLTTERTAQLVAELGDCLWYVAVLADTIGVSLDYVATENLAKIARRVANGTLHGEGDNR